MRSFICLLLLLLALPARARGGTEVIPPTPSPHYIIDEAHVLSAATVQSIDGQLQQVERDTSNQIVVAIYPKMESNDDIAAYGVRVFQAWHIGQKAKNNGVVLLVFIQDRKMNITTGYGLEGALPDATAQQIIENELKPHFKNNDYDGGIQAGVNAILAATRGEYKGSGQTWLDYRSTIIPGLVVLLFVLLFVASMVRGIYGTTYASNGRVPSWVIPFILLSSMTSSGRGGGGFGGGGGGTGGGFSGGGGSTGGGGASGSW